MYTFNITYFTFVPTFPYNNPKKLEKHFFYTIKLISSYIYNFNAYYFTLVQTLSKKNASKFWEKISIHNYSFKLYVYTFNITCFKFDLTFPDNISENLEIFFFYTINLISFYVYNSNTFLYLFKLYLDKVLENFEKIFE